MRSRSLSNLAFVASLTAASVATADVVGPSTLQCPEGFPVQRCHGLEYCSVPTCATDANCPTGSSCADQQWCIQEHSCGRRYPDAQVTVLYGYEGTCSNGTCAKGTCKMIRACSPPPDRGCSCRLDSAGAAALATPLLLLCGLLWIWIHRRRGR